MRTITEQQITALAPNPNAASNARKISLNGGFVSRMRSKDDTFYMGECKGSGKSNYVVSVDFVDESAPVFRCSCPSRQFPCKHSLALMFEMMNKKEFSVGEIPEDILKKREKKEAREAKKAERSKEGEDVSAEGSEESRAKRAKAGKAARTKKIKKQLEGLKLTGQLVGNLMNAGLSTMGSVSIKTYRDLAKQLGDYYLPGPQAYLNQLVFEMESYQKDQDKGHYTAAVEILKKLHALDKKASVYLNEKLEQDTPEADDDILYEELGGIWKLEQLNALGLKKEQASLLQLSFQVIYDEAGKEFVDLGYWADVDTGEVFCTRNYRPVRALKYIKQEDSCFALLRIPVLSCYPGELNRRVRWEAASYDTADEETYRLLKSRAVPDILTAVKNAKNQIKNTLSEDFCAMMISFKQIGTVKTEDGPKVVMEDKNGTRMEIRSRKGQEDGLSMLTRLPREELLEDQVLFGLVYYDGKDHSMCILPLSIITDQGIVRLMY